MDGVVHNPDILQGSNEADLSLGVDSINSVEIKFTWKKGRKTKKRISRYYFFCQLTFSVSICPATTSFGNNCFSVQPINRNVHF